MRFKLPRPVVLAAVVVFVLVLALLSVLYFIGRTRLEVRAHTHAELTQRLLGTTQKFGIRESIKATFEPSYKTIPVMLLDITEAASLKSHTFYRDKHELRTRISSEVSELMVSPGDRVEAGQVLCVLSNETASSLLEQARMDYDLQLLRLNALYSPEARAANTRDIETANLRLEQAKLALELRKLDIPKLLINAPISGNLVSLAAEEGDSVSTGQIIATILDDSRMTIWVQVPQSEIANIEVGMHATVGFGSNLPVTMGTVTSISAEGLAGTRGSVVPVAIEIDNSQTLYKSGMTSNVSIITSDDELLSVTGICSPGAKTDVRSLASGTISQLFASEGDSIAAGSAICRLENPSYELAVEQAKNEVAIAEAALNKLLYPEISVERIDILAQELRLSQAESTLALRTLDFESLVMASPISGVVTRVDVRPKDRLQPGALVLTVQDDSKLFAEVMIPELYARKIQLGQQADVSFDSIPNRVFSARVALLETEARPQAGTSVFRALLEIDTHEQIPPGISANVTITTEIRENVLAVPDRLIFDVGLDKSVMVLREDKKDFWRRKVQQTVVIEPGISDGVMREVRCGLERDDMLIVPDPK